MYEFSSDMFLCLQMECDPKVCVQMTATEQWIFLCAAHKNPKEVTICNQIVNVATKEFVYCLIVVLPIVCNKYPLYVYWYFYKSFVWLI